MATLARELKLMGVPPLLVATHGPRRSPLVDETEAAGVPVDHLGMRRMWDPAGPARLAHLIRRLRPAVVHTRTIRADLIGRVGAGLGAAVVNNVVNVYPNDCLALHGPLAGRAVMAVARATRWSSRLFVANAQAVATSTMAAFGVPAERVRVIYDGLRLDGWGDVKPVDLTEHGVAPDHAVCLTVARLHAQKGLGDLLAAAAEVVAQRPDVRFVVAGDGPGADALRRRVEATGVAGRVILLGHRDDVASLMARAQLFVLSSRFEGLPSAVIEAMAAGLPVVATAVGGLPELVEDGVTGWLVRAASPPDLAQGILQALNGDLTAAGEAGRKRAWERFTARTMASAFAHVYEEAARWT